MISQLEQLWVSSRLVVPEVVEQMTKQARPLICYAGYLRVLSKKLLHRLILGAMASLKTSEVTASWNGRFDEVNRPVLEFQCFG